jgi:peptide deformylase
VARTKEREEETDRDKELARQARKLYVLGNVRQYPDPVLRMQTREVSIFDDALSVLGQRMIEVMRRASGVGLAAPQIGVLQRVLVYQADEDAEPVALVNPRIVWTSEERETAEEGCLSLGAADVVVDVERAARATVEGRSPAGEELRIEAEGLEARVIQHEIDHLDGVLTIDRAPAEQRRAALGELRPKPVLRPPG